MTSNELEDKLVQVYAERGIEIKDNPTPTECPECGSMRRKMISTLPICAECNERLK
jgi:ssDNA-binding Zn-finger/Zn-ribbon topoisomerase 1